MQPTRVGNRTDRRLWNGLRRVVGGAAVGFVAAAALSADFDVANRSAENECARSTAFCLALGQMLGGFAVAVVIVAGLIPLGFRLSALRLRSMLVGMALPLVVEQVSGVNLVHTVHPLTRYLVSVTISFAVLGLIAHALETSRTPEEGDAEGE